MLALRLKQNRSGFLIQTHHGKYLAGPVSVEDDSRFPLPVSESDSDSDSRNVFVNSQGRDPGSTRRLSSNSNRVCKSPPEKIKKTDLLLIWY